MTDQYYYSTAIEWVAERRGDLSAPNLPALAVDAPPEFKGHEGTWTPEHLFVASVNSCFMTTFLAIAENSRFDFVSLRIEAEGKLEKQDARSFMITEITLRPRLVLRDAGGTERALRILEKAERNCLISNSIKTQIVLQPEVTTAEQADEAAWSTYTQSFGSGAARSSGAVG
jgi:organic hydroperoxide reductase OsmC/OhrA